MRWWLQSSSAIGKAARLGAAVKMPGVWRRHRQHSRQNQLDIIPRPPTSARPMAEAVLAS